MSEELTRDKRAKLMKLCYQALFDSMRAIVTTFSGLSAETLSGAAFELIIDYDVFLADYQGQYLFDAHVGFLEMLRQWPAPWPYEKHSCLNGLTLAQFFFVWAWHENEDAKYCLNGEAVAHSWQRDDAVSVGVVAAVSAAKSLSYALQLMAMGDARLGQASE